MRFQNIILVLVVVGSRQGLYSQNLFPEKSPVFIDSEVPRVDIYMDELLLDSLYMAGNEVEYRATFMFTSSSLVDTVFNVGVGLRGNTSGYSKKKSFKISFNTFVSGQKFHGLEKLNLNGEHNDPSVVRSKLCWHIFNGMGVPASRANRVRNLGNKMLPAGVYIVSVTLMEEPSVRLVSRRVLYLPPYK
ncbi:MAG: CotH kinase family protein [Bacteroidales bacterium]